MQPGDLVRIRIHPWAQLAVQVGMVVEEVSRHVGRRTYNVLADGCIYYFYQESLELVNEAG